MPSGESSSSRARGDRPDPPIDSAVDAPPEASSDASSDVSSVGSGGFG